MNATTPRPTIPVFSGGSRPMVLGLAAMLVGLVILIVGWIFDPTRTLLAYLVAFTATSTVALGALAFLMIVHAMNATWPLVVRRLVEAMTTGLLLLAVLFIPVALGLGHLYEWTDPAAHGVSHHAAELIEKKRPWLGEGFFLGRSAFYFLSWIVPGGLLYWWSRRQDQSPRPDLRPRMRALSAGALPLVGLTLTFAAFDWLMSLDPTWFSSMFGIYVFASAMYGAMAVLTLLVRRLEMRGWLRGLINASHYYALGRVQLTFVVFWAYATFFQIFLIWIANKPEEVTWYLDRIRGPWGWLAGLLVFAHFLLPFLVLLSYRLKRSGRLLSWVSAWMLVAHYLHVHWMVTPSHAEAAFLHAADAGALLFVVGSTLAFVTWVLRGHPVLPWGDPTLHRALEYHSA